MGDLVFLILYSLILILQIILLVFSIKRKQKKLWCFLIVFEIVSIIISYAILKYSQHLARREMSASFPYMFGEMLFSCFAAFFYFLMLIITICSKKD